MKPEAELREIYAAPERRIALSVQLCKSL